MALPALILPALGTAAKWLVAGLAGRVLLSAFTQGAVMAATIYWGGDMAEWATGKMLEFVRGSQLWERLQLAFGSFGSLPSQVLQLWGCIGAREVFVALISGQISSIGVAVIARKLL
jgi:hypothetical protein